MQKTKGIVRATAVIILSALLFTACKKTEERSTAPIYDNPVMQGAVDKINSDYEIDFRLLDYTAGLAITIEIYDKNENPVIMLHYVAEGNPNNFLYYYNYNIFMDVKGFFPVEYYGIPAYDLEYVAPFREQLEKEYAELLEDMGFTERELLTLARNVLESEA